MAKKPSFFSRLSGNTDDRYSDDYFGEPIPAGETAEDSGRQVALRHTDRAPQEDADGELAVDVYQTPDAIVVKALVAGVQPTTVDISLTREMLTITGMRADEKEVEADNYFYRELYWGSFSRTILLPEEVDVDMAEASEKHGILMIRLPKVNKKRQTKLKVRAR